MPTTNRSFPAYDPATKDARDPHARIARALERTRAELEVVLSEVHHARTLALRIELVDRALRLHFLGSRLSRRLSMLGDGGLLVLSAIRETDIAAIVRQCAGEVALECGRRQITLDVRLDPDLGSTWLDAEQLAETVRCLIDHAMGALPAEGALFVGAQHERHGLSIVVRDDRPAQDVEADAAGDLYVAMRFAEALDGELTQRPAGPFDTSITETVLHLPVTHARELSEATAPRSNAA